MWTNLLRTAMVVCMLVVFPNPASAQYANAERLRIHGSNTIGAGLMPALVHAWMESLGYEEIERIERGVSITQVRGIRDGEPLVVEIAKNGSAAGMMALVAGNTELAMMARPPNAAEMDAAWQLGELHSAEQEFVIALDGLAVMVHRDNPVRGLSMAQLRDVLSGRITDWQQLGGLPGAISVFTPNHGGELEFLQQRVMEGAALTGSRRTVPVGRISAAVAGERGAIGIMGLRSPVAPLTRPLAIGQGGAALLPTRINVQSEDYPLVQRYSLYGGQMMSALGRSFALFSIGRHAQAAVAASGHIAVTLRPAVQQPLPVGALDYQNVVAGAERLPLSLRFNPGGLQSLFESRAQRDLDRIVAFMRLPANANRQATVLAFGAVDPAGTLVSTIVSTDRANMVADYLQGQGVVVRRSVGLGALRPLVRPTHPQAVYLNDRVEVWVN
ncbi:substrate-binding domain-containing protein [Lysobacter olei]